MLARCYRLLLPLLLATGCGKPVDPSGEEASFTKASMGFEPAPSSEPSRPLAADLAIEPVSMLVMFNRLQTAEKLAEVLNRKPGQFSRIDIDKDSAPDPLTVVAMDTADGRAFEIHARPSSGEYVVATMMFDREWAFMGHYNGVMGGAASTVGNPLKAAAAPTTSPTVAPPALAATPGIPPVATPTVAPSGAPSPALIAGSVEAVPASSAIEAGVK
ncbi:MAG TPA: hypothetical protein VGB85_06480 [Nannocystis sp.]|jgi:hypothetical protein